MLELHYLENDKVLVVLNADNKLEIFKVNMDNKESLLKKLMRQQKRKALKRKQREE